MVSALEVILIAQWSLCARHCMTVNETFVHFIPWHSWFVGKGLGISVHYLPAMLRLTLPLKTCCWLVGSDVFCLFYFTLLVAAMSNARRKTNESAVCLALYTGWIRRQRVCPDTMALSWMLKTTHSWWRYCTPTLCPQIECLFYYSVGHVHFFLNCQQALPDFDVPGCSLTSFCNLTSCV